jgi:hypothetical protein
MQVALWKQAEAGNFGAVDKILKLSGFRVGDHSAKSTSGDTQNRPVGYTSKPAS